MSDRIGSSQSFNDISLNGFAAVDDQQYAMNMSVKSNSLAAAGVKSGDTVEKNDLISDMIGGFSKDVLLVDLVNTQRLKHASLLREIARGQVQDMGELRSKVEALTILAEVAQTGVGIDLNKIAQYRKPEDLQQKIDKIQGYYLKDIKDKIDKHGTEGLTADEKKDVDKLNDRKTSKFSPKDAPQKFYGSTVPATDGFKDKLEELGLDSKSILQFKHTFKVVDLLGNSDGAWKDEHRKYPEGRLSHDDFARLEQAVSQCYQLSSNADDLVKMGFNNVPVFSKDDKGIKEKQIFIEKISQQRDGMRDELTVLAAQVQTNMKKIQGAIQKLNEDLRKFEELLSKLTNLAESGD